MVKAIVYTSKTGNTKEYARLLGEKLALPYYDVKTAIHKLPKNTEIIYLGWLMAGILKGHKKANKHFNIEAVCPVGMLNVKEQLDNIIKVNKIQSGIQVFCLDGGLEIDRLNGISKLVMKIMKSGITKGLSEKQNKTEDDEKMLKFVQNCCSLVDETNLGEIIRWYSK
ncbi:MAG: hypothetical protein PHE51_05955 [Eubacteriales bacterium]|nr:hypothetical protein [Eubacteriales bacterium]